MNQETRPVLAKPYLGFHGGWGSVHSNPSKWNHTQEQPSILDSRHRVEGSGINGHNSHQHTRQTQCGKPVHLWGVKGWVANIPYPSTTIEDRHRAHTHCSAVYTVRALHVHWGSQAHYFHSNEDHNAHEEEEDSAVHTDVVE